MKLFKVIVQKSSSDIFEWTFFKFYFLIQEKWEEELFINEKKHDFWHFIDSDTEEKSMYWRKCHLQLHWQKEKGSYKNEAT